MTFPRYCFPPNRRMSPLISHERSPWTLTNRPAHQINRCLSRDSNSVWTSSKFLRKVSKHQKPRRGYRVNRIHRWRNTIPTSILRKTRPAMVTRWNPAATTPSTESRRQASPSTATASFVRQHQEALSEQFQIINRKVAMPHRYKKLTTFAKPCQ